MKVRSESEVAQSYPTLSDPRDCSPPGSSVHGIFQARVLEWGAIAFSTYLLLLVNTVTLRKPRLLAVKQLAWEIPWTEEPGGLQSLGSL